MIVINAGSRTQESSWDASGLVHCFNPLNSWTKLLKQFSPITFRNHEQNTAKFHFTGSLFYHSGSERRSEPSATAMPIGLPKRTCRQYYSTGHPAVPSVAQQVATKVSDQRQRRIVRLVSTSRSSTASFRRREHGAEPCS